MLRSEFLGLFEPDLGCLKHFDLEINFPQEAKPIFCKPAWRISTKSQPSLQHRHQEGHRTPKKLNAYKSPIVLICKGLLPGQQKPKLWVWGDYPVTVTPNKLETQRHQIQLSKGLRRRLGSGCYFTKRGHQRDQAGIWEPKQACTRLSATNIPTLRDNLDPTLISRHYGLTDQQPAGGSDLPARHSCPRCHGRQTPANFTFSTAGPAGQRLVT